MKEEDDLAAAIGAIAVAGLLLTLVLIAAGGWKWFSGFLESAAPAWVQAIGSIGAIVGAVWLSRKSQRVAEQGAISHYILFKVATRDAISGTFKAAAERDLVMLIEAQARFADAVSLGQSVRFDLLSAKDALIAARFRGVALHSKMLVDQYVIDPRWRTDWGVLARRFIEQRQKVDRIDRSMR